MKLSHLQKIMQALPPDVQLADSEWRTDYIRRMGVEPGEMYQELEMDSRFVDTHRDISEAGQSVSLHSHSFYEILYCRSQCNMEYLVGTQRYRLQKGDVVIVPPGVSHRPLMPSQMAEPYIRDVVWVSDEFVRMLSRWFPGILTNVETYSALLRTNEPIREELGEIFALGVRESEGRSPEWEVAVIGNTLTLLTRLRRACVEREVRPMKAEKPELLDRVLHYIEEHLAQKISLSDVAHHFFVSESTITQLFRRKLNVSFYHCVTQRRLIAAKALIDRNVRMEDVSQRVGFADYSAFYRAFKKEYGISPVQYRKLQHN